MPLQETSNPVTNYLKEVQKSIFFRTHSAIYQTNVYSFRASRPTHLKMLKMVANWQPWQDACITVYYAVSWWIVTNGTIAKGTTIPRNTVTIYQSKRRNILKDLKLKQHSCKNRKHRNQDSAVTSPAAGHCMKPAHCHAGAVQRPRR